MVRSFLPLIAAAFGLLSACGGGGSGEATNGGPTEPPPPPAPPPITAPPVPPAPPPPPPVFQSSTIATLERPWSLAVLPDGRMLVSERTEPTGKLVLVTESGSVSEVSMALPRNIGLLDVVLDPDYSTNHYVYLSLREVDPSAPRFGRNVADMSVDPQGLTVVRGVLDLSGASPVLANPVVLFRATMIVTFPGPNGEFGGRLLFDRDKTHLFIMTGDRQEFGPCQELNNTICKLIRINKDGSIPSDNPFVSTLGANPAIYNIGHRNSYGLTYDLQGQLWNADNGPEGGDKFSLIRSGGNYGWPNVSPGRNYGSAADDIPDPSSNDGYISPSYFWTPSIAPAGLIFYTGRLFPSFYGDGFIPGLQAKGIVRVHVNGTTVSEVARYDLGYRTRALVEARDGSLLVLEDGPTGRLIRLTPGT